MSQQFAQGQRECRALPVQWSANDLYLLFLPSPLLRWKRHQRQRSPTSSLCRSPVNECDGRSTSLGQIYMCLLLIIRVQRAPEAQLRNLNA